MAPDSIGTTGRGHRPQQASKGIPVVLSLAILLGGCIDAQETSEMNAANEPAVTRDFSYDLEGHVKAIAQMVRGPLGALDSCFMDLQAHGRLGGPDFSLVALAEGEWADFNATSTVAVYGATGSSLLGEIPPPRVPALGWNAQMDLRFKEGPANATMAFLANAMDTNEGDSLHVAMECTGGAALRHYESTRVEILSLRTAQEGTGFDLVASNLGSTSSRWTLGGDVNVVYLIYGGSDHAGEVVVSLEATGFQQDYHFSGPGVCVIGVDIKDGGVTARISDSSINHEALFVAAVEYSSVSPR